MSAWIFGSSSDYSIAVGKRLKDPLYFGRNNVDYNDFDEFIKDKQLPDQIFINIGVEEKLSLGAFGNREDFVNMWIKFMDTYYFVYKLLQYIHLNAKHKVTVCLVTSSITVWPADYPEHVTYAILRSTTQQTAFAFANENMSVIAVSPNGITPERIDEYAIKTVHYLNAGVNHVGIVTLDSNTIHKYRNETTGL